MQKNVKQDLQLIKQIRHRSSTIDNIVNICLYPGLYIPKDIINLSLDIENQVDVIHNWDLEGFLAVMYNNGKQKIMVKV